MDPVEMTYVTPSSLPRQPFRGAMASTFKRRSSGGKRLLQGTKAWTGGTYLTSTGLRDLDALLGGGQPIGTCIFLQEDRWTSFATTLVQYWCAQAISHDQVLLLPCLETPSGLDSSGGSNWSEADDPASSDTQPSREDLGRLIRSLPRNLHLDKSSTEDNRGPTSMLETLAEEDNEDANLSIAWQYRQDVQNERLGNIGSNKRSTNDGVFCHSFDLNGRLSEQLGSLPTLQYLPIEGGSTDMSGFTIFRRIVTEIKKVHSSPKYQLIRLLLHRFPVTALSVALPLILAYIREHELSVVVLVTSQAFRNSSDYQLSSLKRTCDAVFELEGFASRKEYPPPAEFRHLHGLFTIHKLSTVTAATANGGGHFADLTVSRRPDPAHLFGLKRDRRKLHIEPLHIPPEDYAEGGGSGSGGVRSGAGRQPVKSGLGCASSGGSSNLDF